LPVGAARADRYQRWYGLLKEEIDLIAAPGARVIAVGKAVAEHLSLREFPIRNAPRTEIQEIYQKLGDLVADGSLSAAVEHVEHVYTLEQFKEAFEQSLKSNRSGKILFKFGDHG